VKWGIHIKGRSQNVLTATEVEARNLELRSAAIKSNYSVVTCKGEGAGKYGACPGDAANSQPIADNGDGILTEHTPSLT
jgi:hypothetical protein